MFMSYTYEIRKSVLTIHRMNSVDLKEKNGQQENSEEVMRKWF